MYYAVKNPHGGDVYESNIRLDFSANVNPFGAPKAVLDAAKAAVDEAEKYPDPYCRELVSAIAEKEGLPRETVFAGCGASELIYAFCSAKRFKSALLAAPSFSEYAAALKRAGSEIVYYRLQKENGFCLQEDLLAFIREQKPDAVFLCNPNNPTGRSIDPGLLKKVLETVTGENACLFLDECFYELSDDPFTLKNELMSHPNLFLLRAFTKSFALAGLRLGYCLCADPQTLKEMSSFTPPWSVSYPAQKAGLAALSEDDHVAASKKKIRTERQWLCSRLTEMGIPVYPSEVNYLFFEARPELGDLLQKEGILIRKCDNYEGLGQGYFRIAVRTHEENEELIRVLKSMKADGKL